MRYVTTYAPEKEAAFVSGQQKMEDYLKDNIVTKIPDAVSKQMTNAIVKFTVNEQGMIDNAIISKTSGDVKTDQLLLQAIINMPEWSPAVNSNGEKVRQNFEFVLGGKMQVGC
jgi:TonB family protein